MRGLHYHLMFVLTINTCFQCSEGGIDDDNSVRFEVDDLRDDTSTKIF